MSESSKLIHGILSVKLFKDTRVHGKTLNASRIFFRVAMAMRALGRSRDKVCTFETTFATLPIAYFQKLELFH